jgi:hypothetical protein
MVPLAGRADRRGCGTQFPMIGADTARPEEGEMGAVPADRPMVFASGAETVKRSGASPD